MWSSVWIIVVILYIVHCLPLEKRDVLDENGEPLGHAPLRRSHAIRFAPNPRNNTSRDDSDDLGIDLADLRLNEDNVLARHDDYSDAELNDLIYRMEGGDPDRTEWTEFACSGQVMMVLERGMDFNTYHTFNHCIMKGGTCCARSSSGQRGVMAYPSERYCDFCFRDMQVVRVQRVPQEQQLMFEFDEDLNGYGFDDTGEMVGRK